MSAKRKALTAFRKGDRVRFLPEHAYDYIAPLYAFLALGRTGEVLGLNYWTDSVRVRWEKRGGWRDEDVDPRHIEKLESKDG